MINISNTSSVNVGWKKIYIYIDDCHGTDDETTEEFQTCKTFLPQN